jgi:glycosyltransferase involved in cell wall biosynthesis
VGEFCGLAGSDVCGRCVALGGAHEASRLPAITPDEHRELFGGLLRNARHVVAPSKNAADYVGRVFPNVQVTTLPHPQDAASFPAAIREGSSDEIVLLGGIGPHKGSAKLLEIARRARLSHPHLSFRVIGHTDIDEALAGVGNVTISGKFEPAELPALLAKTQGRLALFLNGWPETFSYTLTEAVQAGFLPLVPNIGAPAERVKAAGFGMVFDFPIDAVQVLRLLDSLRNGDARVDGDPRSFRLDETWQEQALGVFRPEAPRRATAVQVPVASEIPAQQVRPKGSMRPRSVKRPRSAAQTRLVSKRQSVLLPSA